MALPYRDRTEAGQLLASQLLAGEPASRYGRDDVVVLGLPRGGVPVAAQVAAGLGVRLDVCVVRKLGLPSQPELAIGAIASGGVQVLNEALVRRLDISSAVIEDVSRREGAELRRRERAYREGRPATTVEDRCVVLVDDGLATGATMRAAVQAVRAAGARTVVVAVPIGAPDSCQALASVADEVVCLQAPQWFGAVGAYYRDFSPTDDDEVRRLLRVQGPR